MANRLANETSPYLLQHAHNPVDWYPWSIVIPNRRSAAEDGEESPASGAISHVIGGFLSVLRRFGMTGRA